MKNLRVRIKEVINEVEGKDRFRWNPKVSCSGFVYKETRSSKIDPEVELRSFLKDFCDNGVGCNECTLYNGLAKLLEK